MLRFVLLAASGALAFVIFMIAFRNPTEAGVEKAMAAKYGYRSAQCEARGIVAGDAVFECRVVRSQRLPTPGAELRRCYRVGADDPSDDGFRAPCRHVPGSAPRQ